MINIVIVVFEKFENFQIHVFINKIGFFQLFSFITLLFRICLTNLFLIVFQIESSSLKVFETLYNLYFNKLIYVIM